MVGPLFPLLLLLICGLRQPFGMRQDFLDEEVEGPAGSLYALCVLMSVAWSAQGSVLARYVVRTHAGPEMRRGDEVTRPSVHHRMSP